MGRTHEPTIRRGYQRYPCWRVMHVMSLKEAVFGGQVAVTKSESQWCHIGTQPRSTTENLGEHTDRRESGALSEAGYR